MRACVRTYVHTYIHTYMRACVRTYVHTYIHTYIRIYIHTYIRTYIHTYIHTYINTYVQDGPNTNLSRACRYLAVVAGSHRNRKGFHLLVVQGFDFPDGVGYLRLPVVFVLR